MIHSDIAFLEKFNQPIDKDLENLIFSKLFTFKKRSQIRLIILCFLCGFSNNGYCLSQNLSPQQARTQSKSYQTKAEWFLKLSKYNLDSSFIYFKKAFICLNGSEVSNYQALSEANLNLYTHLLKINIIPNIDGYLKKAKCFFNKTRQFDGRLIYGNNNGTTVLLYFKKTKLAA
jgi:hypothetical protein